MLYSRVISEIDEWKFQHELDKALEEETSRGSELTDIRYSTCPAALSPFADIGNADLYSATRYTALLLFRHTA